MNTIVRRHYPASKLPADLREGIEPGTEVTVTVYLDANPSIHFVEGAAGDTDYKRMPEGMTLVRPVTPALERIIADLT